MKRLTSVLLAVLLVVSMCCVAVTNVAAADTFRYYFHAPATWTATNGQTGIYWWSPSEGAGPWPGSPCEKLAGFTDVFYFDVPQDTPYIIFNAYVDGSLDPDHAYQTVNLDVEWPVEAGDNPDYPAGLSSYDGMIFELNGQQDVNEFSGAVTYLGNWSTFDKTTGLITKPDGTTTKATPDTAPTTAATTATEATTSTAATTATEPTSTTEPTTAVTTEPTTAATTTAVTTESTTAQGKMYLNGKEVHTGDTVTITSTLKNAPKKAAAINTWVCYEKSLLTISNITRAAKDRDEVADMAKAELRQTLGREPTDDEVDALMETEKYVQIMSDAKAATLKVFPTIAAVPTGMMAWNFDAKQTTIDNKTYDTSKFNAVDAINAPYDFRGNGNVLYTYTFDVTGTTPGNYDLFTHIEEFFDINENDMTADVVDNIVINHNDPTTPTETTTAAPVTTTEATSSAVTEATTTEATTSPVVPTTAAPVTTTEATTAGTTAAPVTTTTAPTTSTTEATTASTDVTVVTTASTTTAATTTSASTTTSTSSTTTGKVATGDSTSVAALLAVIMLAAGVVVFARKKISQ